jgi:hypothetical protein
VKEYEIYLPTTENDGTPVDPRLITAVKKLVNDTFGGYTHLRQRNEGRWTMGGVTFVDEVTILRVLNERGSAFDMVEFKRMLEELLRQESVLIVEREVRVVR